MKRTEEDRKSLLDGVKQDLKKLRPLRRRVGVVDASGVIHDVVSDPLPKPPTRAAKVIPLKRG